MTILKLLLLKILSLALLKTMAQHKKFLARVPSFHNLSYPKEFLETPRASLLPFSPGSTSGVWTTGNKSGPGFLPQGCRAPTHLHRLFSKISLSAHKPNQGQH